MLLNEDRETLELANAASFHYYTDVESFKEYVREKNLALEPVSEP